MEEAEAARRGAIALRLKAARLLAGRVEPNGHGDYKVRALSPVELARRKPLRENKVSAHMIGEGERLDREMRQMELRVIAEACGLPYEFFTAALAEPAPVTSSEDVERAVSLLGAAQPLPGEPPNRAAAPETAKDEEGHG